jgi:predicted small secreted protein
MFKFVTALSAAVILGWSLVGAATTANAGSRCKGCFGPIKPSYTYKTKKVYKNVKRYRDVYHTKYVPRIKRIVHVTKIQPIIRVHNVKRIHTRFVGVVKPVHVRLTRVLPVQRYVIHSVVRLRPQCGCY